MELLTIPAQSHIRPQKFHGKSPSRGWAESLVSKMDLGLVGSLSQLGIDIRMSHPVTPNLPEPGWDLMEQQQLF